MSNSIGTFVIGVSAIGLIGGPVPLGYDLIDIPSDDAVSIEPPDGAAMAVLKPEGASVRYRDDGFEPTSTVGMPLGVGETLQYVGSLAALLFSAVGAGAKLNVLFYGEAAP